MNSKNKLTACMAAAILLSLSSAFAFAPGSPSARSVKESSKRGVERTTIYGKDNRLTLEFNDPDFRPPVSAVGVVTQTSELGPQTPRGTGFLVSRCLVLTNIHVALPKMPQNRSPERSWFHAGKGLKHHIAAKPVAMGKAYQGIPLTKSGSNDWVLLKLDTCIGDSLGFFEFNDHEIGNPPQGEIAVFGFPGDKNPAKGLTVSNGCQIIPDGDPFLWPVGCNVAGGNSGSVVITNDMHAIGMMVWQSIDGEDRLPEIPSNPRKLNRMIPARHFLEKLNELRQQGL